MQPVVSGVCEGLPLGWILSEFQLSTEVSPSPLDQVRGLGEPQLDFPKALLNRFLIWRGDSLRPPVGHTAMFL